ncbi:MAG: AMP-binding protein, partial [Acidobacteriota bacterium]
MTRFTRWLAERTGNSFSDYRQLHQWSVDHLEEFWAFCLEYSGIQCDGSPDPVVSQLEMPGARWFRGLSLNYAENLLRGDPSATAILYQVEGQLPLAGDGGRIGKIDFGTLRTEVSRCAGALAKVGIRRGDRVAGYLANVPEAIIAALACAAIGATWSSASPDFGLDAVCDRFSQVEPRVVFASSHYRYSGKTFHTDSVVTQLKSRLPSVRTIVSVPYPVGEARPAGDVNWEGFLESGEGTSLSFERFPFDHPLFILFSS